MYRLVLKRMVDKIIKYENINVKQRNAEESLVVRKGPPVAIR